MSIYLADEADDRDMRRRQLAKRLVVHEARTQTIYDFTGYTRHRLAALRKRWGVPPEARHRGPSPTSFAVFFQSLRGRAEASCVSLFCSLYGAVPTSTGSYRKRFAELEIGERLCEAFEAYRACYPWSEVTFEQFKLIAGGLWKADVVQLASCEKCDCVILIDKLAWRRHICSFCQRLEMNQGDATEEGEGGKSAPKGGQGELF